MNHKDLFQLILDFVVGQSRNEREPMRANGKSEEARTQTIVVEPGASKPFPTISAGPDLFDVSPDDTRVLERFHEISMAEIDWGIYVGKAIRLLRLAHKPQAITQEDLAACARHELESTEGYVDQSYISRVETGDIRPTLKRLQVFARVLGTTVSRILWEAERAAAARMAHGAATP